MTLLTRAAAAGAFLIAGHLSVAASAASYNWTLTTFVPEGNQIFQDHVQTFVDRVRELTDGEVEITPYGVGILSGAFDGYEAVQQGRADLAYMFPSYLVNQDPANALLSGLAAGMSVETMLNWLFAGGGEALWTEFRRASTGLEPIIAGAGPAEIFAHSRKEIRTLEDLEGVKFRTAGAWAQIIQEFGASPTSVAPAELFTALERGTIDAAEFANPGANASAGLHEAAEYIIVPGVHAPASVYEVVIRGDAWDGLPDGLKAKIKAAGRLAAFDSLLKTYQRDLAAVDTFEASEATVVELTPEFLDGVTRASREWVEARIEEQNAAGNDWIERIWTSYLDFQSRWVATAPYRWVDRPLN